MQSLTILEFSGVVFAGSIAAGLLGALTGLGGGIIVIPMLTLLFGIDIRYAAGAALISVIATSSGAASSYVKDGYSIKRLIDACDSAKTSMLTERISKPPCIQM